MAFPFSEIEKDISSTSTQQKMDEAFDRFCSDELEAAFVLSALYDEIREGLAEVSVEKVSVDGDAEEGTISIGMLLPDGAVLSVNKRRGLHPFGVVGFNVIHNRELLVSDIWTLESLQTYQSKSRG